MLKKIVGRVARPPEACAHNYTVLAGFAKQQHGA